jgi:hypothetical protein
MTNKTGYSAVLLDNQSQETLKQLLSIIKTKYPNTRHFGFIKCEHMVIRFGRDFSEDWVDRKEPTIGTPVRLKCREFGFNEKALAVHVNRIERKIDNKPIFFEEPHNEIYHITLAHKGPNDAVESNHIEYWKSITSVTLSEVVLSGTICDYNHELMGWNCLTNELSSCYSVAPYSERSNYGLFN